MINERNKIKEMHEKYEPLRRIRAGNQAVVPKIERETPDIISAYGSDLSQDHISKLESSTKTLKMKQKHLAELDDEISVQCDMEEIKKEVEESTVVNAK